MKVFGRHDREWLFVFLVAGVTFLSVVQFDDGFVRSWILPGSWNFEDLFFSWAIAGGVFGIYASGRDDWIGTSEYLAHRPHSRAAILRARLLGCAIVLLSWLVLPWLLMWGLELVSGDAVAAGRPELALSKLSLATVGIAFFGAGFFGASFPGSVWLRVFGTAALALSLTSTAGKLSAASMAMNGSLAFFALAMAGLGACFLWAAASFWGRRFDEDRSFTPSMRRRAVPLLVLAVAASISWGIGGVQSGLASSYWDLQPKLAATREGEIVAIEERREDGRQVRYRVTDDGRLGEEVDMDGATIFWFGEHGSWSTFDYPSMRYRGSATLFDADGYVLQFEATAREVLFLREARPRDGVDAAFKRVGIGPKHEPFSSASEPALSVRHGSVAWMGDPESGLLYRFVPGMSSFFEPVTLPGEDRWLRAVRAPSADADGDRPWLQLGEAGIYRLGDEGPRATTEWSRAEVERRGYRWSEDNDGLVAHVRVWPLQSQASEQGPLQEGGPDENGVALFERTFRPLTWGQRAHAWGLKALSFARAPLFEVLAAVSPQGSALGSSDPLVAHGRRPLLFGLLLAYAAFSVVAMRKLLRGRGAPSSVVAFWCALVALFGSAAFLLGSWIESERVHRPRVHTGPVPAPLLCTERRAS